MSVANLFAQTIIEEINHKLNAQPYFDLRLDYNIQITIPDSIRGKIVCALQRKLPRNFADSVFIFNANMLDQIKKAAWKKCKMDTLCFEEEYKRLYDGEMDFKKKGYYNRCLSISLILSCGSWNIKEAIPYLEEELKNKQCKYQYNEINIALAKLGNDSIYKQIKESRSLSYLILNTKLDTIDNHTRYGSLAYIFPYGINTFPAYYLKDKSLLYDMIDLLYLKGQVSFLDFGYSSIEISILMNFSMFSFEDDSRINIDSWRKMCDHYLYEYIDVEKDKKLHKQVSSREYKQKMIAKMRKWIDDNVNFE
jgi:hypothetical protein